VDAGFAKEGESWLSYNGDLKVLTPASRSELPLQGRIGGKTPKG